jgi:Rod binding domain-containing protein
MDLAGITNGKQSVDALAQSRIHELGNIAAKDEGAEVGTAIESMFGSMLVKELRRGLDTGFFKGAGADTYTAWLDEHIGQALADRDALGFAGMVKTFADRKAAEAETRRTEETR